MKQAETRIKNLESQLAEAGGKSDKESQVSGVSGKEELGSPRLGVL